MDFNNDNVSIHTCEFEAFVEKAKVQIKFPCNYFLEWKANNGKVIVSSSNRYQANRSQIVFNQTLTISVNLLFDKINKKYLKKESLLMINLISKSRPDQIKLVGRVAIDLAEVLNANTYEKLTPSQLQYCSVEASINFAVKSVSVKESSIHVSQLDRSSFNQYMSFQANLKPSQGFLHRNQGSSTHRDFDDDKSAKGSDKGQIRSLGRDKNKMSSPSLSKQSFTPSNRTSTRNQTLNLQQINRMNRSSSISKEPDNSNKFFSPKLVEHPLEMQNNFSFHKPTQDNNIKPSKPISQFVDQQIRAATEKRLQNSQIIKPKQPELFKISSLKIAVQSANTQIPQTQKTQPVAIIKGPKNDQQELIQRIKKSDQTMSQRQAVIKKLQSDIETKKLSNPLETSLLSSVKGNDHAKRFSLELSKTNSESKRIIGLTQALNELQTKYTNLNLETQEMRSVWKKQKEDLLSAISIAESALASKDKEIREKNKMNEILQHNLQQIQKISNQRLGQIIYFKSQLADSQKQHKKNEEEKIKNQMAVKKLEQEIKILQSQSSSNQDQLNKSFGDRLTMYQEKIKEAENKVSTLQKQKISLNEKLTLIYSEKSQLTSKVSNIESQNRGNLAKIQQLSKDLLEVRLQNERLKMEMERKEKQFREEKERTWSTKGDEVRHSLRLKEEEIERIKKQSEMMIMRVGQQARRQIQRLNENEQKLKVKAEQLQNTIFGLSDQIGHYEQKISELNRDLGEKEKRLREVSEEYKVVREEKQASKGEHEELLLSLNSQIEEQQVRIRELEQQINGLNAAMEEKDVELLQSHQSAEAHRVELQLTRAQSSIYESKLLEQRQYYQKQTEAVRLSCSQQVYQIQIQLQQQLERYQELELVKNMLKQSLDEWQNKCTDDRIASSKTVARLNDIIKEKEQTMYEMENIMRTLERQKTSIQQHMLAQTCEFNIILDNYKTKQYQLKHLVQVQQSEFVQLYQAVKNQRHQLKTCILQHEQTITMLQSELQQSGSKVNQLSCTIQSLRQELSSSQSSMIQLESQSQSKIELIKNQHNQQVDEYEERIRQLQNILNQKDNELLDKEMLLAEQQNYQQTLKASLQDANIEIKHHTEKQSEMDRVIESLRQEITRIVSEKQHLQLTVEEQTHKYTQLQNTLIECEERLGSRIKELQTCKAELTDKIGLLENCETEFSFKLKTAEEQFNSKLQQVQNQHSKALQDTKQSLITQKQQILSQLHSLEQENAKLNQNILQKVSQVQTLIAQKSSVQKQLNDLKTERQTVSMITYKQQIERLKQQLKQLTQENLEAKTQLKEIPSLERTIKIKTIELNSLKYKSSTNYTSSSIDPDQVSHVEQIIKLKNEEIQLLKEENKRMKDLELQLYQLEVLNEQLYTSIEQYEEDKFHLNSELNEKDIKIAELQQEAENLLNSKTELKEKAHELNEKLKYYESLILDFKGAHEMSSTKSQSDKLNTSRISSHKLINETDTQNSTKIQLDTFIKKIKLLEAQLQKHKSIEEQSLQKEHSHLQKIKQLSSKITELEMQINQKDIQLSKKTSFNKSPVQASKPQMQYKTPQQVVNTFKEIQGLLKKRNQFHDLQNTLIKLHESNRQVSSKDKQQDSETKQKLAATGMHVTALSKEFQNLKARIMKLEGKNYQEKAKIISLLRPCQQSLKEVSKLYENTQGSRHSLSQS